ncbi:MAG TPA: hypothetical protein VEN81_03535 [Planctomycetota bacterium]|nr:hypothetical protein [Planctomycetota bacterium]
MMAAGIIPGAWARIVLGLAFLGEGTGESFLLQGMPGRPQAAPSGGAPTLDWKDGVPLPVRVPVVGPGRELLTTLAFPEDSIETAITGWPEGEITAVVKRGLLFLRLTRKSEGQLSVIGGSGTHYLFYLQGVESADPGAYDAYLRIRKKDEAPKGDPLPRRIHPRPGQAVELLEAMRLGLRTADATILRARRELALETPLLEVRLLYVYDSPS